MAGESSVRMLGEWAPLLLLSLLLAGEGVRGL